jgi:hypothetical protein
VRVQQYEVRSSSTRALPLPNPDARSNEKRACACWSRDLSFR